MKKKIILFIVAILFIQMNLDAAKNNNRNSEKNMVIVILSYNNEKWVALNLTSALSQNYENFRIIYIDDHSSDKTFEIALDLVSHSNISDRVTLIQNEKRKGAMKNMYEAIHSCDDNEIVVMLDGDDWFPNKKVLSYLNTVYSQEKQIWLTHGSYISSKGKNGVDGSASPLTIEKNSFRKDSQPTHLKTFYAWLFKKIRKNDLFYEGEFFKMTSDLASMLPMIEMAGYRHAFIEKILYVYNVENPISDCQKDLNLQLKLDRYIRQMPRYSPID